MRAAITALFLTCLPASAQASPPVVDDLGLSAMSAAIDGGDYRRIEAIIVTRDGETVFEDYYRKSGPDSRIDARSAGKSITALAVAAALDDGALDTVDRPALAFFADEAPFEHDGPEKRAVTVADLLSMSSALDCDDWQDSPGNEERMYRTKNWTRFSLDIPIDPDFVRAEDGQGRFRYCTAGAFLIGRIVERATGERFDSYVQRRIFDPLGIEDPEWTVSPSGEIQSGGQLSMTARDFTRVGQLVLDGGKWDGERLLSEQAMTELGRHRVQATGTDGYGWFW